MNDGWAIAESPFHAGEQSVQERLGIRDHIETWARRVVRDHMPDQHREFYGMLPFVLVGSVDAQGRPWASLVPGRPGFMTSPDAWTLDIAARPLFGDPLNTTLEPGADLGILGIQPATRRRNRMSASVDSVRSDGFTVAVVQAFGNCPQYIQTRDVEVLPGIAAPERERPTARSHRFDAAARALIERSDTLFIATAYGDTRTSASGGADVSHRGGKPGFVRFEDDRTFTFPDFSGNNHYNTVGNILLNPKAGFLFIDFEAGDLLYTTGVAEIIWDGEELHAFAGAERLIRFRAMEVIRVAGSLPLRFTFGDYSPMLERTGDWEQAAATVAANRERNVYTAYEVVAIERESAAISSFRLRRADGGGLASYEPGQFLPIRVTIPGRAEPALRTYTLSDAQDGEYYRLSVKREGGEALVSTFLHDRLKVGDTVDAMAPRGKFVLDRSSDRPVVLLSAGVGITPMIAMTNHLINEGLRTRAFRRTYFIHGARNSAAQAFGAHLRDLADRHASLTVHIRYSRPAAGDQLGVTHHSEGHVDIALLKEILPFDDYDFYLCGPTPFMQTLHDGLTGMGVREDRIHYESFGPATVLKRSAGPKRAVPEGEPSKGPVTVAFAKAGIEAAWSLEKGTLLELAEAEGLSPSYACRSGICGTCATRIRCGTVDYLEEPSAPHGDDEVLLCCATPRSSTGEASCGDGGGVVLDL